MAFRNKSVNVHNFAMVPRSDIPRSTFNRQSQYKTTFDSGYLIPVFLDEVLPGDSFKLKMTALARMSTPIFPIMDNLHLDSFFFFIPNRLVWTNWVKFMGEREDPDDSIDYVMPTVEAPLGGYATNSVQDYFGLPGVGQIVPSYRYRHSALPLRAYNLIWNEWFRDENLQDSVNVFKHDGNEGWDEYTLLRRGKRHDYFTGCLPWPQKGESVVLPLGNTAPILGTVPSQNVVSHIRQEGTNILMGLNRSSNTAGANYQSTQSVSGTSLNYILSEDIDVDTSGLYADLSAATAATVNQLRQAFQVQKLLERDARGGTRYTEILRSHFGVTPQDARLQRPEYLGGGSTPVNINPVAQTSATSASGTDTPLGNLAAIGTISSHGHGFNYSATEHGMIIGLVSIRADLSYQQGLRKLWSRYTRYDFYFPVFAMLGEQVVLNKELYMTGDFEEDHKAFGYQERWAEYRYFPSMITGRFKSTAASSLDAWHLSQRFNTYPTLNSTFIQDTPPMNRVLAASDEEVLGSEFIFDAFFDIKTVRPLPMYSVPGLIDHF